MHAGTAIWAPAVCTYHPEAKSHAIPRSAECRLSTLGSTFHERPGCQSDALFSKSATLSGKVCTTHDKGQLAYVRKRISAAHWPPGSLTRLAGAQACGCSLGHFDLSIERPVSTLHDVRTTGRSGRA
jgi:hypothetical protein